MSDSINIGDTVSVNFNNARLTLCHRAIVKCIPCDVGDSWVFEGEDGAIHYVSEGCTITKVNG